MARIRTIKPEFFRHEELQGLGTDVMLVFAGLWTQCDSKGRFKWRPRQLKLDILPFIDFDMEGILGKLESSGFVTRYEVDGKKYGFIPTFRIHQRITGKEAADGEKYPEPIVTQQGNNGETPGKQRGNDGERQDAQEREKERERKGKGLKAAPAPSGSNGSVPPIEHISDMTDEEVENNLKALTEKLYREEIFKRVPAFLNAMAKKRENPRAVLRALIRCYKDPPNDPWPYCARIVKDEGPIYYARQSEKENDEMKTATIPGDIKGLLDGIGKGGKT